MNSGQAGSEKTSLSVFTDGKGGIDPERKNVKKRRKDSQQTNDYEERKRKTR